MPNYDPQHPPDQAGQGSKTADWAEYERTRNSYGSGGNTSSDMMRGLFGGPVGWYELATGKRILGDSDPWDRTTYNMSMTQDVYNSMTPEDWKEFQRLSQSDMDMWVQKRQKELGRAGQKTPEQMAADQEAKKEAEFQAWRQQTMQRLDSFSKEMGKPIDQLISEGDLGAKMVTQGGANQGMMTARAAGMSGGGMSTMNTQRAMADAGLRYQTQRQGMGLQATSELLNNMGNMAHDTEDTRRYNDTMSLQLQQAQAAAAQQGYQQRSQQAGQTMGLIGGAVGAYFGGPAGAQAGYGLGSSFGSSNYQSQNPYQPYQYTAPSGRRPTSGMSGSSYYGGAQ